MNPPDNPSSAPILVVDDEPNIRKLVVVNLSSRGYQVLEASTGTQALALLKEQTPLLMVLDIKLPDFTGWELLNRLMADPDFDSHFPILVMTASLMDAHIDLAKYPQVSKIIIKPFSMGAFVSAVENTLHQVR